MRRFETREITVTDEVLVEERCDGCGVLAEEAEFGLIEVVIEVNYGEEFGGRNELDYCNDCLVQRADAFVAAGSTAEFVTGRPEEEPSDD